MASSVFSVVTQMWNPLESKPDFVECRITSNVKFTKIPHFYLCYGYGYSFLTLNHKPYSNLNYIHNPKF